MSRPRKHKFRTLAVGGSYEEPKPAKWFRSAVYDFGRKSGRYFSVCQTGTGSLLVTRLSGPPTAEQISRGKSNGAKIMHARLKAKKQQGEQHE